ncbi:hypothetical protein SELR_17900 [Selenomonas ruminantium subsp. lactilytica TAM6421]|uniref:Uncharacterized protein n=1 Tax=Selenomonas ruminantium subsp. lactilytica (strain NBRC 103574 / TAM6421) TaxID=927704 RepID=I0GRW1_SELRL|nr:hypothetical protein [Selenomonas ruminantium]BAL83498.1 hypothetical protein SELR_17900 [Selenomonas ruminantium subsp. lactilytica TAM6421]
MGDYAYRKSDNERIKIGTCGAMYYLTFDQWANGEVYGEDANGIAEYLEHMTFRLPLASEKDVKAGDFEFYGYSGAKPLRVYCKKYKDKEEKEVTDFYKELRKFCLDNPYNIKMTKTLGKRQGYSWDERTGIYVNAPCYHGFIPDEPPKGVGYNGFNPHVLAIEGVGIRHGEARVIMCCVACEHTVCSLNLKDLVQNFGCFYESTEDWEYLIDRLMFMDKWAKEHCAEKEVG